MFPFQNVACISCPAGFSCATTSAAPVLCTTGYSLGDTDSCTDCPVGKSCLNPTASPVNCDAGYYSELVSIYDTHRHT